MHVHGNYVNAYIDLSIFLHDNETKKAQGNLKYIMFEIFEMLYWYAHR